MNLNWDNGVRVALVTFEPGNDGDYIEWDLNYGSNQGSYYKDYIISAVGNLGQGGSDRRGYFPLRAMRESVSEN